MCNQRPSDRFPVATIHVKSQRRRIHIHLIQRMRIRILQDRTITNKDVVVLQETHTIEPGMERLEVVRAYHGHDDENGQPITDLTLKAVKA